MTMIQKENRAHNCIRRHHLAPVMAALFMGLFVTLAGCGQSEIRPVDLYPEDACSNCRMAVSDRSFASQMITTDGEVFKFDDLGCLEQYRRKHTSIRIAAIFVSDYETREWLPFEKSIIVQTGISTPMGSGKVAVRTPEKARELTQKFPARDTQAMTCACCSRSEKS